MGWVCWGRRRWRRRVGIRWVEERMRKERKKDMICILWRCGAVVD